MGAEAQEKCSQREQLFVNELTAVNKSLKEDLAHAEGALYTAMRARELAGESSRLAEKGLAEERAAALEVCELAHRSEAELRAELEDTRRAATDTKQALEARIVDMERQLQVNEARAICAATTRKLGPTPVAAQVVVDGSAIANPVRELHACQAQLPAVPAEESGQDVQHQSSFKESQTAFADCGSRPEELLTADPEKDEQHDLQVHSCDRLSRQVANSGKESHKPLCSSAGAHRMLRSCALRVASAPVRLVVVLGAILLMGSLGFRASLDVSTNTTCSDPGDAAGLQTD